MQVIDQYELLSLFILSSSFDRDRQNRTGNGLWSSPFIADFQDGFIPCIASLTNNRFYNGCWNKQYKRHEGDDAHPQQN